MYTLFFSIWRELFKKYNYTTQTQLFSYLLVFVELSFRMVVNRLFMHVHVGVK